MRKLLGSAGYRVFSATDLATILNTHRQEWRLAKSTTLKAFVAFLLEKKLLGQATLAFPYRTRTLYTLGTVSPYTLALRCASDGYFSHYAAMHLHELTDQVPRTIYVNIEQPAKYARPAGLTQSRLDVAFRQSPRVSRNAADYGQYRICLLNGMHTGHLAVEHMQVPSGDLLPVTSIERTLIDITVRPFYAGGVFEVLRAYKLAKEKVDVPRLAELLKHLSYVYPYHQAIGFYVERAGTYTASEVGLFAEIERKYDFYLAHAMSQTVYNKRWRLYVPKGL
jgi:predicted transcriptional regulator of viral defense system